MKWWLWQVRTEYVRLLNALKSYPAMLKESFSEAVPFFANIFLLPFVIVYMLIFAWWLVPVASLILRLKDGRRFKHLVSCARSNYGRLSKMRRYVRKRLEQMPDDRMYLVLLRIMDHRRKRAAK